MSMDDVRARNRNPRFPGMIDCPKGWEQIVVEADEKLAKIKPDYTIMQIKEKFGGLRYYANIEGEEAQAIIREAEAKSLETCQDCGEPGAECHGRWIRTLCPSCDERRQQIG